MLILKKNYGIFTKIIVLQETRSKEAKRVRKSSKKTKEGRTIVVTKQKAKARKIVASFKLSREKIEKNPWKATKSCCDNLTLIRATVG